jgi:flagellar protein FlgJ
MSDINLNVHDTMYKAQLAQMNNNLAQMKSTYLHPKDVDRQKLKESAQQFEAIFFKQMIDQMDKTIQRNGVISGGQGESMFRDMMYDEVSKRMATRPGGSGLGLAEMIYKQSEAQLSGVATPRPGDPSGLKMGKPPEAPAPLKDVEEMTEENVKEAGKS